MGNENLKPSVELTGYEFDDSIDNLVIYFVKDRDVKTWYIEFETPENSPVIIRGYIDKDENIYDIDIVDPQAFMLYSRYDDFEVNGYNIKEMIREFLESN